MDSAAGWRPQILPDSSRLPEMLGDARNMRGDSRGVSDARRQDRGRGGRDEEGGRRMECQSRTINKGRGE